jgi:hypothetical protein
MRKLLKSGATTYPLEKMVAKYLKLLNWVVYRYPCQWTRLNQNNLTI